MSKKTKQNTEDSENIKKEILRLLYENPQLTQEKIVKILNDGGLYTSQATVSKIMKIELKYVKDRKRGWIKPESALEQERQESMNELLRSYGKGLVEDFNMRILKTEPGYSQLLDLHLRKIFERELLGTVVGTDTILLLIQKNELGEKMISRLTEFVGSER